MLIMHTYKPNTKQNYDHTIRLSSYIRYSYNRRIKIIICLIILIFILLHIFQTGLFLIKHFSIDENRNHMIKLDMSIWYGNNNEESQSKIPRYIHQIWISSIDNEEMYDKFRIASNTCIELHSNYNYTLWTHKGILIWLKTYYPWFLPVYQSYRYDMQRIDAMKYLLLFHFGGIYLDLDVKCKVNDLIIAMLPVEKRNNEPDIIFHMGTEGISANTDLIAAKRFHPFFKLAVSQLKSANRWFYLYHLTIILSAGPTFLHGIYRQFPSKDDFYFVSNNLLYGDLIEGVGGGTWYGKDSLFLIHFMDNKLLSSFVIFIIVIFFFMALKFSKKRWF
jgi:mannosyltransferase OCH1-like enzyme